MTQEQAALLKKARESVQAAKVLFEEGFNNFAASRAYYSMFYVVEAFLLADGLTFSKHSAVVATFGQKFIKTGRVPQEYHKFLIEAQDVRNVGDYDTTAALSEKETEEQIQRAWKFLDLAGKLIGSFEEK